MKFQNWHEKVGGRKRGSKNKLPSEMREIISSALENQLEKLDQTIESIDDPVKKLEMIIKLSEMVIPRFNKIEYMDRNDDKNQWD